MGVKPKIVMDTNVLLVSISSRSKYHWIFEALIDGAYELCVSNEILMEYEEIIGVKFNADVAKHIIRTLIFGENIHFMTPYFKWNLVKDMDDNKFVDCYLISNSDMLVTEDKHFDVFDEIKFPKVNIGTIDDFKTLLLS